MFSGPEWYFRPIPGSTLKSYIQYMPQTNASTQRAAAFQILAAITETIRDLKQVPSGELYARLMGHMSFEAYQRILQTVQNTGLITVKGHMITWTGPEMEK